MEISSLIAMLTSALAATVSIITISRYVYDKHKRNTDAVVQSKLTEKSIDVLKEQDMKLNSSLENILEQLTDQNIRLTRLEQTVGDAKLASIPVQLAAIDASLKSIHKRLDKK